MESWGGSFETARNGRALPRWTCTDGDPSCDRDGAVNGACAVVFGTCFSVPDPRLGACVPAAVDAAEIRIAKNPALAAQIQAATDAVLPSTGAACSAGTSLSVPARKTLRITVRAKVGSRVVDSDATSLRCKAGA